MSLVEAIPAAKNDLWMHFSRSRCNEHTVSAGTVRVVRPLAHKFGRAAHSLVAKSQTRHMLAGGLTQRSLGQPPVFGNKPADTILPGPRLS